VTAMKNPQLEDGFTRIANELFEAILGYGFTQRQIVVLLAILRKTYGYGKKEDDMSASQIGKMCNMDRNHVTAVLGQLAKINAISKRRGSFGMVLSVNKNYNEWAAETASDSTNLVLVPNRDSTESVLGKVVPITYSSSTNLVQVGSTNLVHTKETLPKENQQKKAPSVEKTFDTWIAECKAEGKLPIPEDHSVFSYAETIELPIDFVRLCWLEFKRKFNGEGKKKYTDWGAAFSNYVRKNYFRLWFEKEGHWQLTTAGIQLQKEMKGAQ